MTFERFFKIVIDDRDGVPEKRVDEIQSRFHFIGHGEFRGARTVGEPEEGNLIAQQLNGIFLFS